MIRMIFSGVDVLEFSLNWRLGSLCNLKSEAETINQFKIIRKPAQFHMLFLQLRTWGCSGLVNSHMRTPHVSI